MQNVILFFLFRDHTEDGDLRSAFYTFQNNVSDMVKEPIKFRELWKRIYDSWLKIEPEEPDVTDETLIHIKYLLNISVRVHFLRTIIELGDDYADYDYVWIVNFKHRNLSMRWIDKNQNADQFEKDQVEGVRKALLAKLYELC